MKVKAVILAGGRGTRLLPLTLKRAKPAVPFAGKYRIIDFTLSNCVNSGIFDALVLTQYRPHSLNDHIRQGRPWDLDRSFTGGIYLMHPYQTSQKEDWYAGTADAVAQNLSFIHQDSPDVVLILSGDHIYRMDYRRLLRFHREKGADVTIATIQVPLDEGDRYGLVETDDWGRVVGFQEKPKNPKSNLASMGIYAFNYKVLEHVLTKDTPSPETRQDFGKQILPHMVDKHYRVYAHQFKDYWMDVGTIEAFWQAHMDLLKSPPTLDLNDREWIIHTRSYKRPPAIFNGSPVIRDALISDGVTLSNGAIIERSVLSPGVVIGPGAEIRDSIVFNDAVIGPNAKLARAIVDKRSQIGANAEVGRIDEDRADGITVIGKNTTIPPGFKIGRNVRIGSDLKADTFNDIKDNRIGDDAHVGFTDQNNPIGVY